MLINKTLLALSVASLLAFNVQAAEPKKTTLQKNVTTKSTNVKNVNAKNTATPNDAASNTEELKVAEDKDLKAFNQNVNIKLVQRNVASQNEQPVAVLSYEVMNRGKSRIKNLQWLSAFTINNQVFFVQEIQTDLVAAIAPRKTENVTVVLPIDKLPENIRSVFSTVETPIGHITVAKQIDFTNGRKIVVKE